MRVPPKLGPLARSVTLPASGNMVFLYEAGAPGAPGMLLVHGLGDEADTWRRVIHALAERHHVVAPDLPGFGRSPMPPRGRLAPSYLIAVLTELVRHLGMAPVTLVGSSLGATLAEGIALAHPEMVSRLILVDGGLLDGARLDAGMLLGLLPGLGESRYRRLAGDLDAAYGSLRPYYADLDALPAEEREFLRERVAERVASRSQMRAYFSILRSFVGWLILKGRLLTRRARALPIPTLYVWGGRDHIVPVETGERTSRRHPGAKLAVIPEAGHLPHQETPREFLRVIGQAQ
ncbi:MAG: alpha/beta fold hydrolase [Spirochaetia bacterium]